MVLVIAAGVVTGLMTLAAMAISDGERIDGYWASAEVGGTTPADIVEVIDYDFGVSDRHGIFRDVPGLASGAPVQVSSPSAPDQFIIQPGADTRIRIGDPNRTISGRHRYEIRYPIGVVFAGAGSTDAVSWNAVGTEWEVGMRNVELHLVSDRSISDPRCSVGVAGSWDECAVDVLEPGRLVVEVDALDAGQGVTVSGVLGDPLAAPAAAPSPPTGAVTDPGSGVAFPILAAAAASTLGGFLAAAIARRYGRELVWAGGSADAAFGPQYGENYPVRLVDHDELAAMASTEFAPPTGLRAWQGGAVLAERLTDDHKVAWLLEQAIDGRIGIAGSGKNVTISVVDGDPTANVDPRYTTEPLQRLFGGRREVKLGSYDQQFSAAWTNLGETLDKWQDESGLWDPAGRRRRTRALFFGLLGMLVGLVGLAGGAFGAVRSGPVWIPVIALAAGLFGIGAGLLLRRWELHVRTPEGSGLWIRIESFRRFIEGSDAQHVDDAATKGVLLLYTAWAVALDEVDRWSESIKTSEAGAGVAPEALYLTSIAPDLGSATRLAATKPSSSGSGGGGGSVGGGGGGGGGGSW